jgi:hypothetical protein
MGDEEGRIMEDIQAKPHEKVQGGLRLGLRQLKV